jgi:hypothetical protein
LVALSRRRLNKKKARRRVILLLLLLLAIFNFDKILQLIYPIPYQETITFYGEFLSYLHPSVVIQRLVGRGPRERLLFSNWGASWWLVKQRIEEYLDDNDIYQGMKCDYLNGKALRSHGYA